jgi:dephospho-CoA kinase
MIIGITGNYCSGKDSACARFKQAGYSIIDVDALGHEALDVRKAEVVGVFGTHILKGGGIDRGVLGGIVFGSAEKKRDLERIVHPWMIRQARMLTHTYDDCVINAALLFEMCLFTLCDHVIAVLVDEDIAVRRAIERDGLSREQALQRIRSQIPTKEKLHFVDTVIDNNGDLDSFNQHVSSVIANLR